MGTSHHTQESSSSDKMVESIQSDKILELGKKLVEELDLGQTVDTLGRWMAHYIAELIQAVEDADEGERDEKMQQCSAAIKDLWKHRNAYPDGRRPFEDFESVMRALNSLDPERDIFRFFDSIREMIKRGELSEESKEWFEIVDEVERTAKIVIQYCITRASEHASKKSEEWVKIANSLDEKDDFDIQIKIIETLDDSSGQLLSLNPENSKRKQLEDRLTQLERFFGYADIVAKNIEKQIKNLDDSE